ncbi:MAG: PIG-L family deacetylase [Chloroflexi bacterium]|nr:PIG-L family deacetylase [Chloroflexota bacterium]MBA3739922.1 PIG-L family deacetylase [Chloroflexota bacterium]
MSSIWRPVRERAPARSLMVVVAHPGDEAFGFGGAIATAAAEGAYVVVVCVTRGWFDSRLTVASPLPGGKNRDVKDAAINWRNNDTVREDELRRSVAVLGVRVVRMLDYAEGELDQIDFDNLVGRIVEPIRMHRPEVILSFGPDGITGDTDHIVLSRAVRAAYDRAAEPLAYEDDIEEDQVAWRAAKLYQLVVPPTALAALGERMASDGYGSGSEPTLGLDLGDLAQLKLAAISRHVSQTGSAGPFHDWGTEARDAFLASEHYRLAVSALPTPVDGESGLFDGLA